MSKSIKKDANISSPLSIYDAFFKRVKEDIKKDKQLREDAIAATKLGLELPKLYCSKCKRSQQWDDRIDRVFEKINKSLEKAIEELRKIKEKT